MAFVLKSILSDMTIAALAFLSFSFARNIFFHPLTFNLCVSFALKWASCRQHIVGSCFLIPSATLCLLIGAFRPLTFKVISDTYVIYCHIKPCFSVDSLLLLPFYFSFCGLMISFYFMSVSFSFCFCESIVCFFFFKPTT